jgi:hypothetical protein
MAFENSTFMSSFLMIFSFFPFYFLSVIRMVRPENDPLNTRWSGFRIVTVVLMLLSERPTVNIRNLDGPVYEWSFLDKIYAGF